MTEWTQGRPRLKKALADAYSPFFGRKLNPDTEVTITTGANEGILSALMGFVEDGDEVIVFEPFFDQYVPSTAEALCYAKGCPLGISVISKCPAV